MQQILVPPVRPYRGLRGIDAHGAGGFGAPRSKGGERYTHPGLDFVAVPGDAVVRPIPGRVAHLGSAYVDDPRTAIVESEMGSIWLKGTDAYEGWLVKLFYARSEVPMFDSGPAGESVIATAQDRAAMAHAQHPDWGPMTNHVHLGLWIDGTLTDPTPYLVVPRVD